MAATIPKTVIAIMTTPGGQAAIDAATKRNGRVFATYIALLIVSALLIAYFTWFTWDSGNKVQDAIQGDATARIAEANSTALQADARSKQLEKDNLTLQGQVAGLQADASTAKTTQQRVEIELATQQERAANAEKGLLELKERLKPRLLTDAQRKIAADLLSKFQHGKVIVSVELRAGGEGMEYADRLRDLFAYEAKWEIAYPDKEVEILRSQQVTGVALCWYGPKGKADDSVVPTLDAIVEAFKAADIPFGFLQWMGPPSPLSDPHQVRIIVGPKPALQTQPIK